MKPAILGGKPTFDKPRHLVRPILPDLSEIAEDYGKLYRSRMLTNQGVFARRLEKKLANKLGTQYCVLFCNGTTAIMSLIKAMNLRGGVIVPSFTFAATVQALDWMGLAPVFVDIKEKSLAMSPDKIEDKISEGVSAIFPVNLFGSCCDHDAISEIARRNNLPLIYDSAQAFGTKYKGKPVGSLGVAEVFSFHATKIFHTCEGGAVTTNDLGLYKGLCAIRNFGFDGNYLDCLGPGINGKMSEILALIGLNVLKHFLMEVKRRKQIFEQYRYRLGKLEGIELAEDNKNVDINYSYFYVGVAPEFGLSNVELNYALMAENIVTRCYFYPPVHQTTYYRRLYNLDLPETDRAAKHILCLPIYGTMPLSELAAITETIARCQEYSVDIRKALSSKISCYWEVRNDPYNEFILETKV